jgi:oxygen-dependent protoporphyrinogen oxidase
MSSPASVLVIGGGISGLSCASALRAAGIAAQVLEAGRQPGGVIRTERHDGYLCELGPQSFLLTEELLQLSRDLGIEQQCIEAEPRLPRYVVVNGALHAVPMSPPALVASSLLSFKTKMAVLRDAFGHSRPPLEDESVAAFIRRKFTPELLERLAAPFVSGIYAGDPEKLSWRSAFPQAHQAEATSGSLIRGMMRAGRAKPRRSRTLASCTHGIDTLPRAFAKMLGDGLRCNAEVSRIERQGAGHGYRVAVQDTRSGAQDQMVADHIVLAVPAYAAGRLLAAMDSELAGALCAIEYAPVGVVSLGYRTQEIGRSERGFGFLIPRNEGLRTLGTVWNSSLFAGRAPEGRALYTSFIGGATDPKAADLPEAEMIATVQREIAPLLQARGPALFARAHTWKKAIPQYNVGHAKRVAHILERLKALPGLSILGNFIAGPSMGTCVAEAQKAAREIAALRSGFPSQGL